MDSSEYVFCDLFVLLISEDDVGDSAFQSHFGTRHERAINNLFNSIMESFVRCSSHDRLKDSNGSLVSLGHTVELVLVLVLATRMSTSLYSVSVYRLRNSLTVADLLRTPRQTVPSSRSTGRMSKQSTTMILSMQNPRTKRACTSFLLSLYHFIERF